VRALDTNVLLRLIIDDDPVQSAAAERVLAQSIRTREQLFVPIPVLCELVWMLKDQKFKQPKASIVNVIQTLVNDDQFRVESEHQVISALDSYRQGKADFADYLIGQLARRAGCRDTVTFDKALKGSPGFTIL
jgi:predicted nucleic-acid-binding protein